MATLAEHVTPLSAAHARVPAASVLRPAGWRRWAADGLFLLGLFALCVALVALRMIVMPQALLPRDFAAGSLALAVAAAVAAFVSAAAIRGRR